MKHSTFILGALFLSASCNSDSDLKEKELELKEKELELKERELDLNRNASDSKSIIYKEEPASPTKNEVMGSSIIGKWKAYSSRTSGALTTMIFKDNGEVIIYDKVGREEVSRFEYDKTNGTITFIEPTVKRKETMNIIFESENKVRFEPLSGPNNLVFDRLERMN